MARDVGGLGLRLTARLRPTKPLTYSGNRENLSAVATDARLTFVDGDVTDTRLVDDLIPGHDQVLHFAAESDVDRSIVGALPVAGEDHPVVRDEPVGRTTGSAVRRRTQRPRLAACGGPLQGHRPAHLDRAVDLICGDEQETPDAMSCAASRSTCVPRTLVVTKRCRARNCSRIG